MSQPTSVPSRWASLVLEEAVDIHDNLREPVNSRERSTRQGEYPYYGATGQVDRIDGYKCDGEYVLLGEDGAPFLDLSRPTAYLVRGKFWVNNHAHILKGKNGLLENRFLLHLLNSLNYRHHVSGTTRLKLTQGSMRKLPLVLPSIQEQRRIVAKLDELFSELDAGVAALERAQATLKRYRASVLKAAVEGKLTEEWRQENPPDETGEELLERILVERGKRWEEEQLAKFKAKGQKPPKNWQRKYKEPPGPDTTDLPGLPEGWVETDVGSLMSFIQYGHTASAITRATGPRFLRITDIRDSGVDWNTVPSCDLTAEEQEKYRLRPGDLVFARTGATTGKSYLIRTLPDAVFASYLIRLRPTDGIDPAFVYWFFQSPTYWSQISKGKRGVGQPNVNATVLASLRVPVAPSPEQHRIVAILEELFSVVNHLEADINAKLKSAQGLRQSILERAFAGQLVPQDPNDEPASLLLERIRVSREAERPKKSRRSTAFTEWIQSP